ncbi:MAG TPA: hypothetical protein VFV38_50840 [Ktedonobacteraceae bacterium]|nr:hypothetical protein [Ktedonobacteraceae bacterium]
MNHFVQGTVTVEEDLYLSEPDLRLATGETIRILYSDLRPDAGEIEEDNPLPLLLEANQWYELLLIVQIGLGRNKKVAYLPHVPSETTLELISTEMQIHGETIRRSRVTQGIILDLNWDAASQHYLAVAGPAVFANHFVLFETAIGNMILDYQALQKRLGEQAHELVSGGYLEWEPARLDLLAIIEKREPKPGEPAQRA